MAALPSITNGQNEQVIQHDILKIQSEHNLTPNRHQRCQANTARVLCQSREATTKVQKRGNKHRHDASSDWTSNKNSPDTDVRAVYFVTFGNLSG